MTDSVLRIVADYYTRLAKEVERAARSQESAERDNDRLRDRIHEIAADRDRLKVDNERLHRLVEGLWYCANEGHGMCALKELGSAKPYTCCPLYNYETREYGCRKLMRELGIEVSE